MAGTEQWSSTAITLIIGAAGVTISIITYRFQRKQLKLKALMEIFSELNLPAHREARRITYGEPETDASYDLLGIKRPTEDMADLNELRRVSQDIFRGDMNNAATLINHKLMHESIFLEEYWWPILRCWDITRQSVAQRRASGTGAISYMRNLEKLSNKAENYARKHFKKDFKEYEKNFRPNETHSFIDRIKKFFRHKDLDDTK